MNSTTAVAYIRVSTKEQAMDGVSLAAQEEHIRAYCQVRHLEIISIVSEHSVSGSVPLSRRRGGLKLLEYLQTNKVFHVLVIKLDRLFRDAADALMQTKQWNRNGIALHLIDVGGQTINTGTATGRMFLTILAGFAEHERNQIAERTAAALQHKKSQLHVYSPTPLGFNKTKCGKLQINEYEMRIVRAIYDDWKRGDSMHSIARGLNTAGDTGKKHGMFYASTIRRILLNPLYRTLEHVEDETGSWPLKPTPRTPGMVEHRFRTTTSLIAR